MAHLLRTIVKISDWKRKRADRGPGLGLMEKDDTPATGVAKLSVERGTEKIKVHNF